MARAPILDPPSQKEADDAVARTLLLIASVTAELGSGRIPIDALPVAAVICERGSLAILSANRAAGRLYGYTVAELRSLTMDDLSDPEEIPLLRAAIEAGEQVAGFVGPLRQRARRGTIVAVALVAAPIVFAGRAAHLTLLCRSVTPAGTRRASKPAILDDVSEVPLVVWTTDGDLRLATGVRMLSDVFVAIDAVIGAPIEDVFRRSAGCAEALAAHRVALTGEAATFEIDWGRRRYRCFVDARRDAAHTIAGVIGLGYEISEAPDLRRALDSAESSLRHAESAARLGTFELDAVTGILTWSDEMYRIFGREPGSPISTESSITTVHPADRAMVQAAISDALERRIPMRLEFRFHPGDGSERWLEVTGQAALGENGSVARVSGTGMDITDRKDVEERLAFLACHDTLTGLPNRSLLVDGLDDAIAAARRNGRQVAVIFLDLDDFKRVNDSYGHGEGDRIIKICADRLRSCARPNDIVTRVGGDEFIIVLSDMGAPADAARAVARMQATLAEPIKLGTLHMGFGASFGISCYPGDSDVPEALVGYADVAMYCSKRDRRGGYTYFEPSLQKAAVERLELEHDLRDAIRDRELVVHYQPVLQGGTKRIESVEALVRWPRAGGMLSPGAFIPLAEESGLIIALGEFVLRESCRTIVGLHRAGHAGLGLAVNVSACQLKDDRFIATCRNALAETGMPAHLLELEITESYLVADPDRAAIILNEIASLGIRIALDDFGTGYSSLSYLRQFPVHVLKLDRSFMHDIRFDPTDRVIVSAILSLARALGMRSIAEGVESEEQYAVLMELGCDAFQGYHFARPMAASDVSAFLAAAAGAQPEHSTLRRR